jgi:hypothetical protein
MITKEFEMDEMHVDREDMNKMLKLCQSIRVGIETMDDTFPDNICVKVFKQILYPEALDMELKLWSTVHENNGGDIYD